MEEYDSFRVVILGLILHSMTFWGILILDLFLRGVP